MTLGGQLLGIPLVTRLCLQDDSVALSRAIYDLCLKLGPYSGYFSLVEKQGDIDALFHDCYSGHCKAYPLFSRIGCCCRAVICHITQAKPLDSSLTTVPTYLSVSRLLRKSSQWTVLLFRFFFTLTKLSKASALIRVTLVYRWDWMKMPACIDTHGWSGCTSVKS